MAKKYFWLKLKDDFFRQKEIKKLRRIAGGDTYTIIYLKLQLLSVKTEGKLVFEGIEDTFAEELALELDEDVENVKITLMFLQKHGLIVEIEEDEFLLTETLKNIGSESESTERMRKMRIRKNLLPAKEVDHDNYGGNGLKCLERDDYKCIMCGSVRDIVIYHKNGESNELYDLQTLCKDCKTTVQGNKNKTSVTCDTNVTECYTEKDIDIDIDIEKENIYSSVINHLNDVVGTKYKHTSKKTQNLIKTRQNEGYNLEDFIKVIDIKSKEWLNTEYSKYLRPETLFGTKFENYLNQGVKKNDGSTKNNETGKGKTGRFNNYNFS